MVWALSSLLQAALEWKAFRDELFRTDRYLGKGYLVKLPPGSRAFLPFLNTIGQGKTFLRECFLTKLENGAIKFRNRAPELLLREEKRRFGCLGPLA